MEPILDENDLKSLFRSPGEKPPEDILGLPPTKMEQASISQNAFVYPIPEEGVIYPPLSKKEKAFKFLSDITYTILKFATIFILVFLLTYTLINGTAIAKKFKYFWETTYSKKTTQNLQTPPPFDATSPAKLVIPKIEVNAPVAWNVDDSLLNQKLLEGVAHYKGTPLPGERGNVFITGHSSYYSWVRSDYKDVFALLDKLDVGDKIYLQYNQKTFTYSVASSKVVSPDKMEVSNSTADYTLTLMTCVPIGTNLNRLVVTANQIDPKPELANEYF